MARGHDIQSALPRTLGQKGYRVIGNRGAHPQSDPLREVTLDDASQPLEFTFQFLDELYVRPTRLSKLRKKKGIK